MRFEKLILVVACYCSVKEVEAGPFTFRGLGDLPGGNSLSAAYAVSSDGQVVVGESYTSSGSEPFRWTISDGMVGLSNLSDSRYANAQGVSGDGTVVVGGASHPEDRAGRAATRWTNEHGIVQLDDLASSIPCCFTFESEAHGVSADGRIVVGRSRGPTAQRAAVWWNEAGEVFKLSDLPSIARATSADGTVIVGAGGTASGGAFRWTSTNGMFGLGGLNGDNRSDALAVSADGSVVAGYARNADDFEEAFRWTTANGMLGLGDLQGGSFGSQATGISGDGRTIVGRGRTGKGNEAFLWSDSIGMTNLKEYLESRGVSGLTEWTLNSATAISADGRTIVGLGTNPTGDSEAWVATIEPFILSVIGDTNNDFVVDITDLNNVRNNFGGSGLGDTNEDGVVDVIDLNNVRNHFGETALAGSVPEPGGWGLAAIALACLAAMLPHVRRSRA